MGAYFGNKNGVRSAGKKMVSHVFTFHLLLIKVARYILSFFSKLPGLKVKLLFDATKKFYFDFVNLVFCTYLIHSVVLKCYVIPKSRFRGMSH